MCILQLLGRIFFKYLLSHLCLILKFLYWLLLSGWPTYWWKWSTEVTHDYWISAKRVCFMKLDELTFSVYMFTNVVSYWWIVTFINNKWTSFSLLTNFGLMYALSDICIATSSFFQTPFALNTFSMLSLQVCVCLC
jgi:hypothetical protein